MMNPLVVFFLCCLLCGASPSSAVSADEHDTKPSAPQPAKRIRTLMCESESCDSADENTPGCRVYVTPMNACYNAGVLFPGDGSWGDYDVYDEMVMKSIKRTFYPSMDGSCAGRGGRELVDDDTFILPLDVCVGPFGPPRPWGKFTLLLDRDNRQEWDELFSAYG
ncbi:hypothetical protein ACHAXA_003188 [Cyclostephanos tholiformis]|uniref:Uncharacterized protein n=1 Tax=Cyclostephanos tholiformis TaxID=382380 RepID=A0ABD3SS63_9STRA